MTIEPINPDAFPGKTDGFCSIQQNFPEYLLCCGGIGSLEVEERKKGAGWWLYLGSTSGRSTHCDFRQVISLPWVSVSL